VGFFESGISVLVGTRDARLVPDAVRAVGARVEAGGEELTVFLPAATAAVALANVRDNGRIAVTFARPSDHRSFQLKGRVLRVAEATGADRDVVDLYRCGLAKEMAVIGLPPRLTLRLAHWPAHAVRLRVEGVFAQTPGPGAGAELGRAAPETAR
jgi:hypothetical protein